MMWPPQICKLQTLVGGEHTEMSMAALNFAKVLLILQLACMAAAAPREQSMDISANSAKVSMQKVPGDENDIQSFLHKVARRSRSTVEDSVGGRSAASAALQETGKLLRMASIFPAQGLKVVRVVAVPILNKTLALPIVILKGASTMFSGKQLHGLKELVKSKGNDLWGRVSQLKLIPNHHIVVQKSINLGPISSKKTLQIGKPKVGTPTPPMAVIPDLTTIAYASPGTPIPVSV